VTRQHVHDAMHLIAGRQSPRLAFRTFGVEDRILVAIRAKGSAPAARPERAEGVERKRRYAVVMAGGSGTRFWPWSREACPKQLLALTSERSMLAETVARLGGLVAPSNVLVVT